jgi:hypothetical protein
MDKRSVIERERGVHRKHALTRLPRAVFVDVNELTAWTVCPERAHPDDAAFVFHGKTRRQDADAQGRQYDDAGNPGAERHDDPCGRRGTVSPETQSLPDPHEISA